MSNEQKVQEVKTMLGSDLACDEDMISVYLDQAKEKILNKRYLFGTTLEDVEERYEHLQCELAIALINRRGGEGENSHSENGVSHSFRTVAQILEEIPSYVGLPL
jgi:hypothetical protein